MTVINCYHVYIKYLFEGKNRADFSFDISKDKVEKRIVKRFNENNLFWFGGRPIYKSMVKEIFIFGSNLASNDINARANLSV